MDGKPTAEMALKYKGVVVSVKSAHFAGPEWKPHEHAVAAGKIADIPMMIDYGYNRAERPLYDLLTKVGPAISIHICIRGCPANRMRAAARARP